jgi:hypothetical protein
VVKDAHKFKTSDIRVLEEQAGFGAVLSAPFGLIVGPVVGSVVGGERWQRIR